MKEIVRTDNPVFLSFLEVRLEDAGIKSVVLDRYTSSAYGGALQAVGARVMVDDDDFETARRVLAEIENGEAASSSE